MGIRETIDRWLDQAEKRGMETYGKPLEDADDRCWQDELVMELIDALYYAAKENQKLREKARTPFDE